ncbi:ribosome biogenesis protein ytm1 [Pyricularia oryzae]|uniref:Ribosome biogenesis protein YTM1 n=2 Tax=Pyricularia TaxID=48558 RepID=YTM1_PYRO7|nr:ribosome biogenesis protein YTM1 [Pyricularia oryzae 70-15]A4R2Q6.2 RecName: Full=Ribosome biogenesis protein YTM1 [Pyricularia oryzae 70-15]KAH8842588.1 ribosome biogenesis protein ytm1 [Pyricularia oryzae]KAI6302583.1 ribosome biogenesis protein ytm1 [Pyricularia grisea]EHA56642.1 ribosome biogenesis protein YTM1 [Pyricularia oryzae 70-15]KAH9435838.1 ribosome biogenesis protein ytm1 [Pyricularia oryzae]KAI6260937.1 ribosome biogenesis protein ytm1 [Pyricularia oryzae]
MNATTEQEAIVKVLFTTTEQGLELPESKRLLLVPADIRRYGLSRVLNSESMLNTAAPIPFDFLVNGTFLRTTLEDYLKENGLPFEKTVTLQYVRSLVPPAYEASFEHDDWVSSVDLLSATSSAGKWSGSSFLQGQDRILSASYDGLLRIWNGSGQALATSSVVNRGPLCGLKSAKFMSSTKIAAAGLDRTVRIWDYTEADDHFSGQLKPTLELYGHRSIIESLGVDGSSRRILTACADGSIGLWTTSKKLAPEAPTALLPQTYATKRRKGSTTSANIIAQRGALSLIPVHSRPVSAAIFDPQNQHTAYSASQDHTLKVLDLTTSRVVSTITTSNALMSACYLSNKSAPLIAAGTSSRNVTLIDPRESAAATSVMTLRGHINVVSSVSASPDNEYSLVSGSHDGTCRIWDLRSVRPAAGKEETGLGSVGESVYLIERESLGDKKRPLAGEGVKVFDVQWDKTWGIVSGGEDKKVQINKGRNIISS